MRLWAFVCRGTSFIYCSDISLGLGTPWWSVVQMIWPSQQLPFYQRIRALYKCIRSCKSFTGLLNYSSGLIIFCHFFGLFCSSMNCLLRVFISTCWAYVGILLTTSSMTLSKHYSILCIVIRHARIPLHFDRLNVLQSSCQHDALTAQCSNCVIIDVVETTTIIVWWSHTLSEKDNM